MFRDMTEWPIFYRQLEVVPRKFLSPSSFEDNLDKKTDFFIIDVFETTIFLNHIFYLGGM